LSTGLRKCARKGIERSRVHEFEFGTDPLPLHPFLIRVFSCQLPSPALYSVEFVYNDVVLESCAMLVEKST
jgi:hypothetical protein